MTDQTTSSIPQDPDADEVFDLDAAYAQRTEANAAQVRLRVGGRDFVVPTMSNWPLEAVELVRRSDVVAALGIVVDDDEVMDILLRQPMAKIDALFDHVVKASGVTPGESKGSGKSSRSTRKR